MQTIFPVALMVVVAMASWSGYTSTASATSQNLYWIEPDPDDCRIYWEGYGERIPCMKTCPPNCKGMHSAYVLVMMQCPAGLRFNPVTLQCDYPDNVPCPHNPECPI